MGLSFLLNDKEKAWLSSLARQAIALAVGGETAMPGVASLADALQDPQALSGEEHPVLKRQLGAFVTISIGGHLRGCIGSIVGREPLQENVWRMARAAALEDPRFPPLTGREWQKAELEITVLDELSLCPEPERIEIGRHGLVLEYGGRCGVFLPQVPVEQGWDRESYLENLCLKAGVGRSSWRSPEARLYWFEGLVFQA